MQNSRVLLVADHLEPARLLYRHCQEAGFDVVQVESAGGAERELKGERFDAVIIALRLAEGGFLTSGLRCGPGAIQPPVILLASPGDRSRAMAELKHGVQDVLVEGQIDADTVSCSINNAISRQNLLRELRIAQNDFESRLAQRERELKQANARLHAEAAERIRAEKAMVESVAQYRFMADCMPQIVWTTDPQGKCVYVNQGWTRYTGRSVEEAMQGGWAVTVHPEDAPQTLAHWRHAIENGTDFEAEYRLRAADGDYRWHLDRALPRRNAMGEIVEWIGAATDIDDRKRVEGRLKEAHDALNARVTERTSQLAQANAFLEAEVADRKRAESEALRAREFAEAANRLKSEFLVNMSHEIRTPMNGIIGMTELVLETDLEPQQREYLHLVHTSAESLLSLINPVLDFAKIEAGRIQLETEPFSLSDLLEDTLKAIALRAMEKGLELLLDIDSDVPKVVMGDSVRLRQIVTNLVGNAIKFTDKGSITTRVTCAFSDSGHSFLRFAVIDTGIGIPEDKHQQIFEAFAQADGSITRRYGGTGLGLAIVNSLVRQMGGVIQLRSVPGEGSTFEFDLPIVADSAGRTAFDYPPPVEPMEYPGGGTPARYHDAFAGVRILVVEGQGATGGVVEMLRTLGAAPQVVRSGAEALREIGRAQTEGHPFRLVLADATMGDLSEIEFAEAIAAGADSNAGSVKVAPVVLMFPGADAPANFPAEISGISSAVQGVARIASSVGSPVRREATTTTEAGSEKLRVLVAEDNPINQRVAESILLKRGHSVTIATNGLEAVEAVRRELFDLILMDIQMPEMDGLEATRMIRSLGGERARIPIVAMTAHAMKGDDQKCLAAGMDHYLSKPFHKQQLLEMVENIAVSLPE